MDVVMLQSTAAAAADAAASGSPRRQMIHGFNDTSNVARLLPALSLPPARNA